MVERIGIIRDADEDATGAFMSVRSSLINAGLTAPLQPRVLSDGVPRVSILTNTARVDACEVYRPRTYPDGKEGCHNRGR